MLIKDSIAGEREEKSPPDPAPQILVGFFYHLLGGMHARRNDCTLWG